MRVHVLSLIRLAVGCGVALGTVIFTSATVNAQFGWYDNDGPVLIWVTIRAYPGEEPWEACRRVYQRDVYQAADRSGNRVRCRIDHSRIYQRGEVRQNFNRR